MLVYNNFVIINQASQKEVDMMKYCNSYECESYCRYRKRCDEFQSKYGTIPYLFKGENGKLLNDFGN